MKEQRGVDYRYSLGNEELDELVGKADSGSVVLIEGLPGSGKTILALSIVYRNVVEGGVRATYVTLGETPEKLLEVAESLGMDIGTYIAQGLVRFVKIPMIRDIDVVSFISKLASSSIYGSRSIVVIDSVTPIIKLLSDYTARRSWLQNVLYDFTARSWGLTVLVADLLLDDDPDTRLLEYIADVVIELRYRFLRLGAIERTMRIKKLRGRSLRIYEYPFEIHRGGIKILNYVSERICRRRESLRKLVKIECPALQRILGEELEPGTQIIVLDRRKRYEPSLFFKYWLFKVANLAKNGYRIGIIGYDLYTVERVLTIMRNIGVDVEKSTKVLQIDPFTAAPSIVLSEELRFVEENIDFLVITDIEKIVEIYGSAVLRKYALYALQNLRRLGVVAVRHYVANKVNFMVQLYIDWSDIAVELIDDAKPSLMLLRARLPISHTVIYEDDVRQCIEREFLEGLEIA